MGVQLPCRSGDDPLLDVLRQVYGAHPIRVPDSQVKVLTVLAAIGKGPVRFRGALEPLVEGLPPFEVPSHLVAISEVADIAGTRSSSVNVKVGFKLLEGFAAALGLANALPTLQASFSGATKMWFSFKRVTRSFVDINVLARLLGGRKVVINPATRIFFDTQAPADFLLVDSVLRSNSFTVGVEQDGSSEVKIDIGAIERIVGEVSTEVKVERSSNTSVAFTGPTPLTFAFSCKLVDLAPDGAIVSFDENRQSRFLSAQSDASTGKPIDRSYVADLVPASPAPLDVMVEVGFET
jgi:hypothetical protein